MKPDIFMTDFERTENSDSFYAVIGRAVTFATKFEKNAKALYSLLQLKGNLFVSSDEIDSLLKKTDKKTLVKCLYELNINSGEANNVLKKARLARNEVAHELSVGFARNLDLLPQQSVNGIITHAKNLSHKIAEGDCIISILHSILNNDPLPNAQFISTYSKNVACWVTEL